MGRYKYGRDDNKKSPAEDLQDSMLDPDSPASFVKAVKTEESSDSSQSIVCKAGTRTDDVTGQLKSDSVKVNGLYWSMKSLLLYFKHNKFIYHKVN